jgi:hypothetical protein
MDFWISARKSRKEKVRKGTIRAIILELTEEKRLGWLGHVSKQTATENFRMGSRGNAKKEKTQGEMDRWSKTGHDKLRTDRRGY